MIVRRLTEADVEALWDLRLRALQDTPEAFGGTYEETVTRGIGFFQQRLRNEGDNFWLGAFEDALIGMVGFLREEGPKYRHKGLLIGMYVESAERGKGVGKALVHELITRARKMPGLVQIHLAVVTSNEVAHGLYRSLGFEVYGIEPRALQSEGRFWDEELMVVKLS